MATVAILIVLGLMVVVGAVILAMDVAEAAVDIFSEKDTNQDKS